VTEPRSDSMHNMDPTDFNRNCLQLDLFEDKGILGSD